MITAECPLCNEGIELGMILKFGQRLYCPACEAVLEVASLNPIRLDWLYFDQYISEDDTFEHTQKRTAECPLCLHEITTPPRLKLGQCIFCPACDAELEVVWLNPLEFNWPYGEVYLPLGDDYQGDLDYIAGEA